MTCDTSLSREFREPANNKWSGHRVKKWLTSTSTWSRDGQQTRAPTTPSGEPVSGHWTRQLEPSTKEASYQLLRTRQITSIDTWSRAGQQTHMLMTATDLRVAAVSGKTRRKSQMSCRTLVQRSTRWEWPCCRMMARRLGLRREQVNGLFSPFREFAWLLVGMISCLV